MRSRLDEKDSIIKKKDLIIDDLRIKIENFVNEIKELKIIIDALKKEKEELLKIVNEQSITIKNLRNNYNKMKEATLISVLSYQLYYQFLLKHVDDEIIRNNFIKFIQSDNSKIIADVHTKLFQRFLDNNFNGELNEYLKEKFKKAVNSSSNNFKFSYEYNTKQYDGLVYSRNQYCNVSIKDISEYNSVTEFFLHADEEIQKLSDEYKQIGKDLLEQIQNLFKVKIFILIREIKI